MNNVLFCHSSIERILTSLMKKFCEEIPCGIWLFTIKTHLHEFAILLYPDVGHSRNITILSYFNGTNKSLEKKCSIQKIQSHETNATWKFNHSSTQQVILVKLVKVLLILECRRDVTEYLLFSNNFVSNAGLHSK